MYTAAVDRSVGEEEWRPFVAEQKFGHFIAPGDATGLPVVSPTQYLLDGDEVLMHFAAPNPVLDALEANPRSLMSVAGDWAFIPSAWKVIGDENPLDGIPTTYYAAVQLKGRASVIAEPSGIAEVLRRQLHAYQPDVAVSDPAEAHGGKLRAIRAVVLHVEEVAAKFKFGGNVDAEHRRAVIARLRSRGGPGDLAAAAWTERRLGS